MVHHGYHAFHLSNSKLVVCCGEYVPHSTIPLERRARPVATHRGLPLRPAQRAATRVRGIVTRTITLPTIEKIHVLLVGVTADERLRRSPADPPVWQSGCPAGGTPTQGEGRRGQRQKHAVLKVENK